MHLPEKLQNQSFATWNHIVKGLVQVWEMAHLLGMEEQLERRLLCDKDAVLAQRLGDLGNDPKRMANALRHCLETLPAAERMPALCAVTLHRMDNLPFLEFSTQDEFPMSLEEMLLDETEHLIRPIRYIP